MSLKDFYIKNKNKIIFSLIILSTLIICVLVNFLLGLLWFYITMFLFLFYTNKEDFKLFNVIFLSFILVFIVIPIFQTIGLLGLVLWFIMLYYYIKITPDIE